MALSSAFFWASLKLSASIMNRFSPRAKTTVFSSGETEAQRGRFSGAL